MLATREAPAGTHIKPKDMNGALAAAETMGLKPENVKVVPIEYAEDEIDHDALDHRDSSGTSWTGTDGPSIPDTPGPRVGGRRFAGPGGTTSGEQFPVHRIDCGAFGVDAMMDDNDDDFNGTLNVSAQDKTTEKPNEMPEGRFKVSRSS